MVTVTYKVREAGTDRPFAIRGNGNTRADAVAEAKAKIAMVVGVVSEVTISDVPTGAETGAVASAAGLFSDADLVLRNSAGKVVTVRLENVTTAIGTGIGGLVDLSNDLVTAFAAAYKDGSGAGGYSPFDGRFISSGH